MRLAQAMEQYLAEGYSRFHMPGHKGLPLPGTEKKLPWAYDLTELPGLDSLFAADGPIRETEREYAALYGSADTLLSAGGATLCIQAMLSLALSPGDSLLAARGTHGAAVNTMALLGLHPVWMLPPPDKDSGLPLPVTPQEVRRALLENPEVKAVYITSPDYFGAIADIGGIASECHAAGLPLLVDNAHGAHLAFMGESLHPVAQGADLCCDSLHKTLPVLTGGALLHVRNGGYEARARRAMALFGSTSPGYPVMMSADLALDYLRGPARAELSAAAGRLGQIASIARRKGFVLPDFNLRDPMRLTLGGFSLGYPDGELGDFLRGRGIEPEYSGGGYAVLMASPFNSADDFIRLEKAVAEIPPRAPCYPAPFLSSLPERVMGIREAVFARQERVRVDNAAGRVCGAFVAPCPPGIALLVPGERVNNAMASELKNGGISHINVLY